jgi:hypothetical protein
MPGGIGALGGLGNALTGYNQEYDQSLKQLADIAFGKTLQLLSSGQQPPQPPMPQPQGWAQPQGQPPLPGGGPQAPQVMQPPPAPMQGMPPQGMPQGQPGMMPQQMPQGGGMPPPMQRPPMPQGGGQMPPQQQQPTGGQMPQGMPQGGQQGPPGGQQTPQLNWQTIFQKVRQANPGATPQVLAAAVDRFMPLMNQQSQQQWKEVAQQMKEMQLGMAQQRVNQGEQRNSMELDRINMMRQQAGLPPLSQGEAANTPAGAAAGPDGQKGGAATIGDAIIDYKQPPTMQGLYRQGPAVRAYLAQKGFNQAKAIQDWNAQTKLTQTMNGPQQVRFRQLANSVQPFLDDVKDLAVQMDQSGLNALNDLELKAKSEVEGNTPEGQLATRYLTAINGIRGELAQLENGGYAPTDPAWKTAYEQVNAARGVKAQLAAIDEMHKIIGYRIQGMDSVGGNVPGSDNPYSAPKTGEPTDKSGWTIEEVK